MATAAKQAPTIVPPKMAGTTTIDPNRKPTGPPTGGSKQLSNSVTTPPTQTKQQIGGKTAPPAANLSKTTAQAPAATSTKQQAAAPAKPEPSA